MSNLWLPESVRPHRRNVQLTGLERICVLVHKGTNRILCFARDDWFTKKLARQGGYKIIEIMHAHDYDRYAKLWREQAKEEGDAEDASYLERESATRKELRRQLRERLNTADPVTRKAIDSALHCLEVMEKRRQRYRGESFLVQEAYEADKQPGEELVHKLILNQ